MPNGGISEASTEPEEPPEEAPTEAGFAEEVFPGKRLEEGEFGPSVAAGAADVIVMKVLGA